MRLRILMRNLDSSGKISGQKEFSYTHQTSEVAAYFKQVYFFDRPRDHLCHMVLQVEWIVGKHGVNRVPLG